ncbi:MAG TPA: hypothetical protein VLA19_29220 [Herpetosiphonaceae bacterium]|nr:hypothetical protein [Herpetosiphonaceae bacterium]
MRSKSVGNTTSLNAINRASVDDIERMIQTSARHAYGRVLLKRIRVEIGGLAGTLLPRDAADSLADVAENEDLASRIYEAVEANLARSLDRNRIATVVNAQKETLDADWSDPSMHLTIAPGEEIVDQVFQNFDLRYKKSVDAERIAKEMHIDEIQEEIKELIQRIIALATPIP